jgi:hypothetical protein
MTVHPGCERGVTGPDDMASSLRGHPVQGRRRRGRRVPTQTLDDREDHPVGQGWRGRRRGGMHRKVGASIHHNAVPGEHG